MAQIYYRDIEGNSIARDMLYQLKADAKNDNMKAIEILKAIEDGEDVAIGEFYKGSVSESVQIV